MANGLFNISVRDLGAAIPASLAGYTAVVLDPTDGAVLDVVSNPAVDVSGHITTEFTTSLADEADTILLVFKNTTLSSNHFIYRGALHHTPHTVSGPDVIYFNNAKVGISTYKFQDFTLADEFGLPTETTSQGLKRVTLRKATAAKVALAKVRLAS